jgi:hypothetical protein
VAESHLEIWNIAERESFSDIWNFDAHHDCGYGDGKHGVIECDNWGLPFLINGTRVHVRYPRWRAYWREVEPKTEWPGPGLDRATDTGQAMRRRFDTAFVCRSGAWVPAWLDDEWDRFTTSLGGLVVNLQPTPNRRAEAHAIAEQEMNR